MVAAADYLPAPAYCPCEPRSHPAERMLVQSFQMALTGIARSFCPKGSVALPV
jgi:hypothetical protein